MLKQYQISKPNLELETRIRREIDTKTKPPGSLGRIEELALKLALCQGTLSPTADPAQLFIFAADHGLTEEGVSAWPSEITAQMVLNFLSGGAAANVFARTNQASISIVDAGVASDLPDHPNLIRFGVRKGTRNTAREDALTQEELQSVLEKSAALAHQAVVDGFRIILLGEMGIGNTSSATLVTHAITGIGIEQLSGPGAGLDDEGVRRKIEILEEVARRATAPLSPEIALRTFGGLEIAAMAGALIGAASAGACVLVDGFIASSAALAAVAARPEALDYVIFSHRSKEPGHHLMMEAIGTEPLIDLDLRLGEGTGALLALPLLRCACAMLTDMATFESAGVSSKES